MFKWILILAIFLLTVSVLVYFLPRERDDARGVKIIEIDE